MEKKLSDSEIIDIIKNKLVKGEQVNKLCEELNIDEIKLFGYINELKDNNINITMLNKSGDMFLSINNSPDYTKENIYTIKEDNEKVKIGFISDLRIGSKNEQIALLNDIYKKYARDGVKYVFIAGNLLEGKYNTTDEKNYGMSLISNDAFGQADHLIEFFPKVEGIKTLFITGDTDHTWNKELNIGEYIASNRSDMEYLGPKSCTININNTTFRLESLKTQKYSRSMASHEDYDFIVLGGTLTAQDFPQIRDTRIFTVPSVVERTPKMIAKSQQNTMGSYEFNIEFDKTGKIKRFVPLLSPYYVPSKENYLTTKPLILTKDDEDKYIVENKKIIEKNDLLYKFDKLYRVMRKEEKFNDLKNRFDMSDNELYGVIDVLKQYGRPITITDVNGELVVQKKFQKRRH